MKQKQRGIRLRCHGKTTLSLIISSTPLPINFKASFVINFVEQNRHGEADGTFILHFAYNFPLVFGVLIKLNGRRGANKWKGFIHNSCCSRILLIRSNCINVISELEGKNCAKRNVTNSKRKFCVILEKIGGCRATELYCFLLSLHRNVIWTTVFFLISII